MTDKSTTSKEKLHEALALVNEAARDEKEHVTEIINDKYSHLKDLAMEQGTKLNDVKKKVADATLHARDVSVAKSKELAGTIDDNVHRNPWPYLGGAAVGGLLLGYILGRKS